MRHSELQNLLDELLENSDEILIRAKSKRAALYGPIADGSMILLGGDFSGSEAECEVEVRRLLNDIDQGTDDP